MPSTGAGEPRVPRPLSGAPDAGSQVGHDVATPPSVPPSAPPLDLNLRLPRGGEISSGGSHGVFQVLPRPPEHKSKLGQAIEEAAKPDCRTAHAGNGLLAVVPLVKDAVTNKGCKW